MVENHSEKSLKGVLSNALPTFFSYCSLPLIVEITMFKVLYIECLCWGGWRQLEIQPQKPQRFQMKLFPLYFYYSSSSPPISRPPCSGPSTGMGCFLHVANFLCFLDAGLIHILREKESPNFITVYGV
jgi:hypothetical protein